MLNAIMQRCYAKCHIYSGFVPLCEVALMFGVIAQSDNMKSVILMYAVFLRAIMQSVIFLNVVAALKLLSLICIQEESRSLMA